VGPRRQDVVLRQGVRMGSDSRDKLIGTRDQDRLTAHPPRKGDHEVYPALGIDVRVGTGVGGAVYGTKARVVDMTVETAGPDAPPN